MCTTTTPSSRRGSESRTPAKQHCRRSGSSSVASATYRHIGMPADHFQTIMAAVEYRLKIERSEFLGIAFPIRTDDEFFSQLAVIEKRHFDATHHCWAFRIFGDGNSR